MDLDKINKLSTEDRKDVEIVLKGLIDKIEVLDKIKIHNLKIIRKEFKKKEFKKSIDLINEALGNEIIIELHRF